MSSRVHKVSDKYVEAKPEIDLHRRAHARRRNKARDRDRLQTFKAVRQAMIDSLPKRSRDELRSLAKEMDIKGGWRMSKGQLVEVIRKQL